MRNLLNSVGGCIMLVCYTFTDLLGHVQQIGNGRWMLLSFYISRHNKIGYGYVCQHQAKYFAWCWQTYPYLIYMHTFWSITCFAQKYTKLIFPMVLYEYETWSLTLMEEHRQGAEIIWTEEDWNCRRLEKNLITRNFITCTVQEI
jgi:hypothetical protein